MPDEHERAVDAAIAAHGARHLDAAGRSLLRSHFGHDPDEPCPELAVHGLGAGRPDPGAAAPTSFDSFLAAAGLESPAAYAVAYAVPNSAPVYDQLTTPRCVAYACGGSKATQDSLDTGLFAPDFGRFFSEIGGTANGALLENGLGHMKSTGYPVVGLASESAHRIGDYVAVTSSPAAIKAALMTLAGELLVIGPWGHSWLHPFASGLLPAFDYSIGGHCWRVRGWSDLVGSLGAVRCRNSWGTTFGLSGDFYLGYGQLSRLWEVRKTVDVVDYVARSMACGANVRATAGSGSTLGAKIGTIAAGATIRTKLGVAGGTWTKTCVNPTTPSTGSKWYPVVSINGVSVATLYGHSVVYIYAGAVSGG